MADADHEFDPLEDLESKYVKKEIQILLYRLQGLPEPTRARLQGELTQALLERSISVETPRGRVAYVTLNRPSAGRAATMLTKQPRQLRDQPLRGPRAACWPGSGAASRLGCSRRRSSPALPLSVSAARRHRCSAAVRPPSSCRWRARRGVRAPVPELPEDRRPRAHRRHPGRRGADGGPARGARSACGGSESSSSGRRVIETLEKSGLRLDRSTAHGASDLTFVRQV